MQHEHYAAARNAAAVVEQDWIGILRLTGSDRIAWLHGMVTNDVEKLRPGEGCYAAHLTPQGRLVAQMAVLIDQDAVWLSLERAAIEKLAAAFDRLIIMEDAIVENVADQYAVIGVLGPLGAKTLEDLLGEPLNLDSPYQHRCLKELRIVRTELGYDVWAPRSQAGEKLQAIEDCGAVPIDHAVWDMIRTEAGLPVYGVDIDETTTMPELGERGINYDKGCYIGQEVVAKVKYIGHVNRKFMGFICDGDDLPAPQSKVRSGEKEVGYITTRVFSPRLGKPIALGFVSRAAAAPGSRVKIVGKNEITATVARLPFE